MALATYGSGSVKQGLTVSATLATITNGSSVLLKAVRTLRPSASAQDQYELSLYIPMFVSSESAIFSLSAAGKFPLSSNVVVNSYSVSVTLLQVHSHPPHKLNNNSLQQLRFRCVLLDSRRLSHLQRSLMCPSPDR